MDSKSAKWKIEYLRIRRQQQLQQLRAAEAIAPAADDTEHGARMRKPQSDLQQHSNGSQQRQG